MNKKTSKQNLFKNIIERSIHLLVQSIQFSRRNKIPNNLARDTIIKQDEMASKTSAHTAYIKIVERRKAFTINTTGFLWCHKMCGAVIVEGKPVFIFIKNAFRYFLRNLPGKVSKNIGPTEICGYMCVRFFKPFGQRIPLIRVNGEWYVISIRLEGYQNFVDYFSGFFF